MSTLLGRGKSGYSYLKEVDGKEVIFKEMHYEECSYYDFGNSNKVDLEVTDYYKLRETGLNIPTLLEYNRDKNFIIKEYIDGPTAKELVLKGEITPKHIESLVNISNIVKSFGYNIDFYPSNFVIKGDDLYYIDYEVNPYKQEWDLENWGIFYWIDRRNIDNPNESGIPYKDFVSSSPLYSYYLELTSR